MKKKTEEGQGLFSYSPATINFFQISLFQECQNGDYEAVEALLKSIVEQGIGVNIDFTDINGNTPLILACRKGYTQIARALIEAGADINKENNFGDTPLVLTSISGNSELAVALLDAGANVNYCYSATKDSPLHFAFFKGNYDVMNLLLTHNHGIALLYEAHESPNSLIDILSREDIHIDFEPMIELISDSFDKKPKLKENKGAQKATTQNYAKAFAKIISGKDGAKITASNALKIIAAFEELASIDIDNNAYTKFGIKFSSLEKLIKIAAKDSSKLLELLNYAVRHINEDGYKYAAEIASKILAQQDEDGLRTRTTDGAIISDSQIMVAIHKYEFHAKKPYIKSLPVLKQEISSLDPSDDIYFDQANIPLVIKILKELPASLIPENAAQYLAKYARAEEIQEKLTVAQALFGEMHLKLSKTLQSKKSPAKSSKVKAGKTDRSSDTSKEVKEIEEICKQVASAKEAGVFLLSSKDFIKSLQILKRKLPTLQDSDLLNTTTAEAPDSLATETFDGSLSLENLVKYVKSKDQSFRASVKASFRKPESKLDAKQKEKFIRKLEIAILQAKAKEEISEQDSNSLFRLKDQLPSSFLKAYLENTSDGKLTAILDKFDDISDRTTISGRSYATSKFGARSSAGLEEDDDDRGLSDFEADPLDAIEEGEEESKGDSDSDNNRKGSDRGAGLPKTLAKNHIEILEKIKDKVAITKDELQSLAGEFLGVLEYKDTKSGFVLKSIDSGDTAGSHREHSKQKKFKSKSGDGGKAADLFKLFDEIGFFDKYLPKLVTVSHRSSDSSSNSEEGEEGSYASSRNSHDHKGPDLALLGAPSYEFAPFDEVDADF